MGNEFVMTHFLFLAQRFSNSRHSLSHFSFLPPFLSKQSFKALYSHDFNEVNFTSSFPLSIAHAAAATAHAQKHCRDDHVSDFKNGDKVREVTRV